MVTKLDGLTVDLLGQASRYLSKPAVSRIKHAITVATTAHQNQTRSSGDPYICHPLKVALILANLEQDEDTVIAGILHDTIEDSDLTQAYINSQFGHSVSQLVSGVTKLGKLKFESKEELQAENYRKMLLAMAEDIRVIVIKLADRWHNMETLKYLQPHKQARIAQETLDIYAPLAHRLGMANLKWELEDLSLYYLEYDAFQEIKQLIDMKRSQREDYISHFIQLMESLLKQHHIDGKVVGRPKHFYSIYKKMGQRNLSFNELYDTLGVRIILKEVTDCYAFLGAIHADFSPIAGRFKDYIALPKSNMYQSLHTTVIGPEGKPVEIQLRTAHMHKIAEYGVAAHWQYKANKQETKMDSEFVWLRQLLDDEESSVKPKAFLHNLKMELFTDEIFVFTPRGDVHFLAKGAVPIDFAYRIHSEVGHRYVGAKVNGYIVPIDYQLKSGDQVDILTAKKESPKADWLQVIKTRHARNKIRQWLKLQQRDILLTQGRHKLERVTQFENIPFQDIEKQLSHANVLDKFHCKSSEELLLMIAQGDCSVKEVVKLIAKDILKVPIASDTPTQKQVKPSTKKQRYSDIIVLGERNIETTLAKCCSPLPGDAITGIVVPQKGVSIHRSDCDNILSLPDDKKGRLIDVVWDTLHPTQNYTVALDIEAFDRIGVLQDILGIISDQQLNMIEVKTGLSSDGSKMKSKIVIQVSHIERLQKLKDALLSHPDVIYVGRPL